MDAERRRPTGVLIRKVTSAFSQKLTHVDEPQIDMESKDFAGSYFLIHERKHRENKWKTHRKQSKNN